MNEITATEVTVGTRLDLFGFEAEVTKTKVTPTGKVSISYRLADSPAGKVFTMTGKPTERFTKA